MSQKFRVNEISDPCRFIRQVKQIGSRNRYDNSEDPCWLVQQVNEISSMGCFDLRRCNLLHRPHKADGVGTNSKLRFLCERHEQADFSVSLKNDWKIAARY